MARTKATLPKPSRRYMRDCDWITRHFATLSKRYANRWIAVFDGKVVANGLDRSRVTAAARKRAKVDDIVCQYVDDGTSIFVQPS